MSALEVEEDTVVALTQRPSYATLQGAARKASLTGGDKVRSVRVPARLVRRAEIVIARSGLGAYLQAHLPLPENRPSGGAQRVLTVDAVLIGLLVLAATEQPMILRDCVDLLNGLHPSTKHRLGIPRRDASTGVGGVTERMVSRLFNQIAALLDPSPHTRNNLLPLRAAHHAIREAHPGHDPETRALRAGLHRQLEEEHKTVLAENLTRLRYVLDRGLDATLPDEPHTGSYAIDSTEVTSWAHPYRRQPKRPELYPDPDARHNGKGDGWYGFWGHGIVRVPEVDGTPTACLIERIELTAANADVRAAALELLERMVTDHEVTDERAGRAHRPRRDIIADRAYTSETHKAEDWIWPLFDLGFDSVHALTEHQLGLWKKKTKSGAIIVDGQPASPRMPEDLRTIPYPAVGASRADIDDYMDQIERRRPFMLYMHGGRRDDGSWDFGCRAMSLLGQVRCTLKPKSMNKPQTPDRPTADPTLFNPRQLDKSLHKICMQQTARTQADELPFWQHTLFGSREWWASWNRRNLVEGLFGNFKNDASQNITRGRFRVMGLAKVSLMVMFVAMATNMRLTDTFAASQDRKAAEQSAADAGEVKQIRKPRFRTQLRTEMRERIAAREAARAAQNALAGSAPPTLAVVDGDPPDGA